MLNVVLLLSNFVFDLSSGTDFSNTESSNPISTECTHCWPAWRAMWFRHLVIMEIFLRLHFFLTNRRHPYRWVAVVSWLNYLILIIHQSGSSLCIWIHPRCFTSTMLHPMVFNDIHTYDTYNNLLLQNLLSSDMPRKDNWIIIEAVCLSDTEFDIFVFTGFMHFRYLTLMGFNYVNFPSQ